MTLRVVEGWDYLPDSPLDSVLGAAGWSGNGVDNMRCLASTAFGFGKSMSWDNPSNANTLFKFLRGNWTTGYVLGVRLTVPTVGIGRNLGLNGVYVISGIDATATRLTQWTLNFDQFGVITFVRSVEGEQSVFARTPAWAFVPGAWFYLEVKVVPGYTDGELEIRVNTVPVLALTGIRTADGSPVLPVTEPGITHLSWQFNPINNESGIGAAVGQGVNWRSDDFYFLTLDGALNNNYLGNVRVKYMAVIANAGTIQWDIGGTDPALTNWQSVLNINTDDTRYVTTSAVGDTDLYDIDPNLDTPYVYGLELAGAYRQDDATQRFVKNVLQSGASLVEGEEYAINQSYSYYYDIFEVNPATLLPFTGAEANAINIGPRLVG